MQVHNDTLRKSWKNVPNTILLWWQTLSNKPAFTKFKILMVECAGGEANGTYSCAKFGSYAKLIKLINL